MFKKDLQVDIKNLVQKSYLEEKKKHGLVKEAQDKKLPELEEFDVEKHTSFIQIRPKEWGIKGTFEADQLDSIVESIVGNIPSGIKRFKECLTKMNSILAKTPGEFSFPAGSEGQEEINSNVRELFGSLQLNNLLNVIIRNQEPTVAGKIFEGLVARMFGASAPSNWDVIEDLVTEDNRLISLKVIDPIQTDIKGSKYNLAKAISESGAVTYLICEKDKKNNPFSFKSYSFTINKDNFFNFILKKDEKQFELNLKEVEAAISSIVTLKTDVSGPLSEATDDLSDQKIFASAVRKYAIDNGAIEGDNVSINNKIRQIVQPMVEEAINAIKINPKFFDKYFPSLENLSDMFPKGSGGVNPLQWKTYEPFRKSLVMLQNVNLSDDEKAKYFENDSEALKIINGPDSENKRALLSKRQSMYSQRLAVLLSAFNSLRKFSDDIEKTMKENERQIKSARIEAGKTYTPAQSVKIVIDNFFNNFRNYSQKTGDKESGFKISPVQAKRIAMSTNSEYDDSYPEFIVESGFLFTNSQKNTELLKKWIEPIYKNFYYLDRGLKRYYLRDETVGMKEANESVNNLKTEIEKHPGSKGVSAKDINLKNTPNLQENTNKHLTNDWSMDILNELLK